MKQTAGPVVARGQLGVRRMHAARTGEMAVVRRIEHELHRPRGDGGVAVFEVVARDREIHHLERQQPAERLRAVGLADAPGQRALRLVGQAQESALGRLSGQRASSSRTTASAPGAARPADCGPMTAPDPGYRHATATASAVFLRWQLSAPQFIVQASITARSRAALRAAPELGERGVAGVPDERIVQDARRVEAQGGVAARVDDQVAVMGAADRLLGGEIRIVDIPQDPVEVGRTLDENLAPGVELGQESGEQPARLGLLFGGVPEVLFEERVAAAMGVREGPRQHLEVDVSGRPSRGRSRRTRGRAPDSP